MCVVLCAFACLFVCCRWSEGAGHISFSADDIDLESHVTKNITLKVSSPSTADVCSFH